MSFGFVAEKEFTSERRCSLLMIVYVVVVESLLFFVVCFSFCCCCCFLCESNFCFYVMIQSISFTLLRFYLNYFPLLVLAQSLPQYITEIMGCLIRT
jgi:hypothetical protein